jgi:hypothetical protein
MCMMDKVCAMLRFLRMVPLYHSKDGGCTLKGEVTVALLDFSDAYIGFSIQAILAPGLSCQRWEGCVLAL